MRNTTPTKYLQQLMCAAGMVVMAGESSAQSTAASTALAKTLAASASPGR